MTRCVCKLYQILCLLCCAFFTACYQSVAGFQSIGLITNSQDSKNQESLTQSQTTNSAVLKPHNKDFSTQKIQTQYPLIFYKECSKNGAIWLYSCQTLGLESIYDAIRLELPHTTTLQQVRMFLYPQGTFVRFEIFLDSAESL